MPNIYRFMCDFVMPEYDASVGNVHIIDSYKVSKFNFKKVLKKIKEDNPLCMVFKGRSMFSLNMEWTTHNFLYMIGYERERTQDADLNWPMPWVESAVYCIVGFLTWLFIS